MIKKDPSVIIYGGSFDPPHKGHEEIAQFLLSHFKDAKLWIVPADIPPKVGENSKSTLHSFEQRLELCKKVFLPLSERVLIKEEEKALEKPNYTFKTIEYFKKTFENESFAFAMGQDQIQSFNQWKNPEKILELCDIIAIRRQTSEANLKDSVVAGLRGLGEANETSNNQIQLELKDGKQSYIYYFDITVNKASSTQLRMALNGETQIPIEFVPDSIKDDLVKEKQ